MTDPKHPLLELAEQVRGLIALGCVFLTFPLVDVIVLVPVWPMFVENVWDGRSTWFPAVLLGIYLVAFVAILRSSADDARRTGTRSGSLLGDHPIIVCIYYPAMLIVCVVLLIRSLAG